MEAGRRAISTGVATGGTGPICGNDPNMAPGNRKFDFARNCISYSRKLNCGRRKVRAISTASSAFSISSSAARTSRLLFSATPTAWARVSVSWGHATAGASSSTHKIPRASKGHLLRAGCDKLTRRYHRPDSKPNEIGLEPRTHWLTATICYEGKFGRRCDLPRKGFTITRALTAARWGPGYITGGDPAQRQRAQHYRPIIST